MNRIDRLFGIVLRLQGRRRVRAEELAEAFQVSKRTIYRDILALNEVGVPVVSLPGQGYELMQGFFLPPLVFTRDEAAALLLGTRLLRQQAGGRIAAGADAATAKIAAALPAATRDEVERLAEMVSFLVPQARFDLDDPRLAVLQQAIEERRLVRMRYHSLARDELTARDVEPQHLTYSGGVWYLDAYCRLRRDERGFRLNRIDTLNLLAETFPERRARLNGWEAPRADLRVRVLVEGRSARWVRERQHYGFVAEEAAGSDVIMTYAVEGPDEIIHWLRSWGPAVRVLEPGSLRERLRNDAQATAERLA